MVVPVTVDGVLGHLEACSQHPGRTDDADLHCSRSFNNHSTEDAQWGWPGVTPAAILTDSTAGAPRDPG